MNKEVVVTGAGGFIGSHLVRKLLNEGANVHALLRYTSMQNLGNLPLFNDIENSRLEIIFGDVTDSSQMEKLIREKDIVYHLAALIGIPYSYEAPHSYVNTNIIGTINILEAMIKNDINLGLFTSTSEVYGTAQYTPIDEKHPLQGQSPYSATKIGADKLIQSYNLSFDLPAVIIRPFNTFGPGQSTRAVIPTIITQALTLKNITLGDVSTIRDYLYVEDTVKGFIHFTKNPYYETPINLSTSVKTSIREIAEKVLKIVKSDGEIIEDKSRFRPLKSEVKILQGDSTLANGLGWEPNFNLDKGLEKTINWFRDNMVNYEKFVDKYVR